MDRGVRSSLLQTYWPSDNNRTYYRATVAFRLFGILRPTAFYRGLDERSKMIMVKQAQSFSRISFAFLCLRENVNGGDWHITASKWITSQDN